MEADALRNTRRRMYLIGTIPCTWSFCIWRIADSQNRVSPKFRNHVIENYLLFVLALHGQPSEISSGPVSDEVEGLCVWRDLFLHQLKARFGSSASLKDKALKEAVDSLDRAANSSFPKVANGLRKRCSATIRTDSSAADC